MTLATRNSSEVADTVDTISDPIDEFKRQFRAAILDVGIEPSEIKGTAEADIAALESQFNQRFPAAYRAWLLTAGMGAGRLWKDYNWTLLDLPRVRESYDFFCKSINRETGPTEIPVLAYIG